MIYRIVLATSAFLLTAQAVSGQVDVSSDSIHEHFIRQNLKVLVIQADTELQFQEKPMQYSENIDQLLDSKTGVGIVRRGNYASEVVNRGFSSERMTTNINGMKIHGACTDKMDPVTSYVAANNLQSASVDNNASSCTYGSNTGGQLSMQTIEPVLGRKETIKAGASVGANSISNGRQTAFNTSYSTKNFGLNLNGMTAKHENYVAGGGKEVPFSQYEKYNFGAAVKQKLSERDFLLADYIRDVATDVGYPALPMDASSATADIYSVTYRRYFNQSGKLNFKVYGNSIVHVMDDSEREVVMHMDMPGLSNTYGAYLEAEWNEIGSHNFTVLVEGVFNRSYAEMTMYPEGEKEMFMLTWPDVHRLTNGVYARDRYEINDRQELNIGLRYDHATSEVMDDFGKKQLEVFDIDANTVYVENLYSAFIGFGQKLGKVTQLTLEGAYSERLPSVSEQFAYFVYSSQDGYDYIGDPLIKKEKSIKVEVGMDFHWKKISWTSAAFAYHMPDYITGVIDPDWGRMTIGAEGVKRYVNLEYARIYGIESEINWAVANWVKLSSSIAFNHGSDMDGEALPLMSPLKNRSTISLFKGQNAIHLTSIGSMEQNRPSSYAGEDGTPGYLIFDADYRRKIMLGSFDLTLFVGVENIADNNYWDHLDWNNIPRPGRNFFLKLEVGI